MILSESFQDEDIGRSLEESNFLEYFLYQLYNGKPEFEILREFHISKKDFIQIEKNYLYIHFNVVVKLLGLDIKETLGTYWDTMAQEFFRLEKILVNSVRYWRYYRIFPAFIYMFLKAHEIPLSSNKIVNMLHLDRQKFFQAIKDFLPFYSKYRNRNRTLLMEKHISKIKQVFQLPQEFEKIAKKVLFKIEKRMITKERVISAMACCITLILLENENVAFYNVCQRLNVAQSTIIYHLRRSLFSNMNIEGIHASKELIKQVFDKFKL
jgi:hypothetical protein